MSSNKVILRALRFLAIILVTFTAGCDHPKSTSGTLKGYSSIAGAEKIIANSLGAFVMSDGLGWVSQSDGAGGALSIHLKGDGQDALLKTRTTKAHDGAYELTWTCEVSGRDQTKNEKIARRLTDLIAAEDAKRAHGTSHFKTRE